MTRQEFRDFTSKDFFGVEYKLLTAEGKRRIDRFMSYAKKHVDYVIGEEKQVIKIESTDYAEMLKVSEQTRIENNLRAEQRNRAGA